MAHPWDDDWEDIKPLRKGGQGVTRLVKSKAASETRGVLKYLINNRNSAARARMRREVANLQSLASLGGKVPQVLAHNTDGYRDDKLELFMVMEYIPGPTLKEFLESNGLLSVDEAVDFAVSLCETVRIAHTEGILHRDIKPDNIVLKDSGNSELYIVDYGLSFNAADDDLTEAVETFRNKFLDLPETNTPGGDRRDPRSDVTALCAVFYYMLTGHHPGQLHDATGRLPHLRPGFTVREALTEDARRTQVELLLSRGLAPQLQSRFQTVDEFSERLTTLREQGSTESASDPILTAKELSAQLREQDRRTQLAEFRPTAAALLQDFSTKVRVIGGKLEQFKLDLGYSGMAGPAFADGLDAVSRSFRVAVKVDHHEAMRYRTYQVASRGEQCVVCACDFVLKSKQWKPSSAGWKEIAWYDGTPTDVVPALEREFKTWLDTCLQQITHEVLTSK